MNNEMLTANPEANIVIGIIPCVAIETLEGENGLEPGSIRRYHGPMTLEDARAYAMQMIINGAPTGLNTRFNRYFTKTMRVHTALLMDDYGVVERIVAGDYDFSQCCRLEEHEEGEA